MLKLPLVTPIIIQFTQDAFLVTHKLYLIIRILHMILHPDKATEECDAELLPLVCFLQVYPSSNECLWMFLNLSLGI